MNPSPENPVRVYNVHVSKHFASGKSERFADLYSGTCVHEALAAYKGFTKPKNVRTRVHVVLTSATNKGDGFLVHLLHQDVYEVRVL